VKLQLPCPNPPVTLIGKVEAGKSRVDNAHPQKYSPNGFPAKLQLFSSSGVRWYSIWVTNVNEVAQMV
jgi:hypothetical protein